MFIVIDGPDGSGKTTLASRLTERLCNRGQKAIYTSEPTDTSDAGKTIRQFLQNGGIKDPYAFADLFVIDRKEHLTTLIQPHLEAGDWVVCDRYKYSALAYQQMQGVDAQYLINHNQSFLVPDVAFLLIPQDTQLLLDRIQQRGETLELFERRELLSTAVNYYRKLPIYFPGENLQFLDAGIPIEENLHQIESMLMKL